MTERLCSIDGCDRKHQGHGYCNVHYQRWLKYGDAEHPGVMDRRSWEERFEARVLKTESCWLWTGPVHSFGYGVVASKDCGHKSIGAHRASYLHFIGDIPDGMCVCHVCDNPRCVRPEHLFLGTNKANIADMVAKRRNTRGESHPKAKLTERQVREIRSSYTPKLVGGWTIPALAEKYGLSTSTVGGILRRKIWRDVA